MVSDLVSQNINIFLRNTVKVTGVVVFMFSLSWQLSLVTFMGFPIIMMVSDIYGKYYKVGPAWSLLESVSTGSSLETPRPLRRGSGSHQGPLRRGSGGHHTSGGCICVHSHVYSFSKYLLSIYYVQGPGIYHETDRTTTHRELVF